jgi:hypothetical protein
MPELAHPFYLLKPGEFTLSAKAGLFAEEHEYEVAKVVQDLFEYNHNFYKLASTIGIPGQRQFGLELSALADGELSKEYSPTFNIPKQYIQYKGFHAIEFFYQEHLKTTDEDNQLAFEVRLKGSPLNGKEANNTYQGKDIAIALLYSHLHDNEWRIYGTLKASVIGKEKVTRSDGELETVDAFSQFGNLLGVQWLQNKYWLEANALFYLTTDYISRSVNYNRITDKGFIVGGKILFGYYIRPNITFTIEHLRQGQNFNVIAEQTSEDKEFEIESQYTQLGVTWFF